MAKLEVSCSDDIEFTVKREDKDVVSLTAEWFNSTKGNEEEAKVVYWLGLKAAKALYKQLGEKILQDELD